MNIMKLIATSTKLAFAISLTVIFFSFTSCSQKTTFLNSSVVPGAEGGVKVSKDHNNNRVIKVHISNLADPSRLDPSRKEYVVWMVTDNATKNIGRIESSRSFLSKRLTGELETITTFEPTKIFITAEDNADIQYPQGQEVLTTRDF